MPDSEDTIYIKRTLNGDVTAYGKLVDKYKTKAYTLALRIAKNSADAEEISQDAFMKAYKALGKFKQDAGFSTWLYRIVYNTALTAIKKKRLDTTGIEEYHYKINDDSLTTILGSLVAEDRRRYLTYALNELPEDEAAMINLFYTHDKDMNEIAAIMGMTHVNVRVKLSRTRKKLYQLLEHALKDELKNIV